MEMRLDRVIRRQASESNGVYSLLLNDDGLYIFRTGIVGGLVLDDDTHPPAQIVVNETNLPLIEAMLKCEARVKSVPPEQLIAEDGNDLLGFASIIDIRAAVQAARSTLHLDTAEDSYDFQFTTSDGSEVAELVVRLHRYVKGSR